MVVITLIKPSQLRARQDLSAHREDRACQADCQLRAEQDRFKTSNTQEPDGVKPGTAGEMTVALGGNSVLSTFIQPKPFICGRDVAILSPISPMTDAEKLWWATQILANHYRFNYGRQANRTLGQMMLSTRPPGTATAARMSSIKSRLNTGINEAKRLFDGGG